MGFVNNLIFVSHTTALSSFTKLIQHSIIIMTKLQTLILYSIRTYKIMTRKPTVGKTKSIVITNQTHNISTRKQQKNTKFNL